MKLEEKLSERNNLFKIIEAKISPAAKFRTKVIGLLPTVGIFWSPVNIY